MPAFAADLEFKPELNPGVDGQSLVDTVISLAAEIFQVGPLCQRQHFFDRAAITSLDHGIEESNLFSIAHIHLSSEDRILQCSMQSYFDSD